MSKPDPTTPEGFKAARLALGLSQAGMADALGLSKRSIGRMEHGDQPISTQTLKMLNLLAQGKR